MTRLAVLEGNRNYSYAVSGSRGTVDASLISDAQLKSLDPAVADKVTTGTAKPHPSIPGSYMYIDSTGFNIGQLNAKQIFLRESSIAAGLVQKVINEAGEKIVDNDTWIAAKLEREAALRPKKNNWIIWAIGAAAAFKLLG